MDPIGAIYWGPSAPPGAYNHNLYNTANHVYWHAGMWGLGQSTQWFANHGVCIAQDGGQADGSGNRHHQRVVSNLDYTVGLEWVTIASPHWEHSACGGKHAVTPNWMDHRGWSGFDIARQFLSDSFINQSGHYMWVENWGAVLERFQCNGWGASSNGNVRFINIPGWNH